MQKTPPTLNRREYRDLNFGRDFLDFLKHLEGPTLIDVFPEPTIRDAAPSSPCYMVMNLQGSKLLTIYSGTISSRQRISLSSSLLSTQPFIHRFCPTGFYPGKLI